MCRNGDACRPLHASWVNGRAYAVAGEGSHEEIAKEVQKFVGYARFPDYLIRPTGEAELETRTAHPFETRWTQERVALWQPNTARFYKLEDVPTKKQFDMAQEQFDKDMGTWEKARDWVLAAAELFGRDEMPFVGHSPPIFFEPLWVAANLVLRDNAKVSQYAATPKEEPITEADASPEPQTATMNAYVNALYGKALNEWAERESQRPVANEKFFEQWAERFSERKNRIPLWAN